MDKQKEKQLKRTRRHKRNRAKIKGTKERPRFNVFRSNNYLFIQLIDDVDGKTIFSVNRKEVEAKKGQTKTDVAFEMGKKVAEKAKEAKVAEVVFDKGGYRYHGRVKAAAEGAREGGLKF